MDLFTHLMFGFLISSWGSGKFYNTYVIFSAFVAILPDSDIFMMPLWKKYPILRHHGITHTLVFAFTAPIVIFGLFFLYSGFNDIKLLILMWTAACSHIFSDFITNWGVPLFYPVSKKYYKLNLEMAVSPVLIIYFFIGISILRLGQLHYFSWLDIWNASYLVGWIYVIYFALRVCAKLGLKIPKKNRGFSAIPTMVPWRWRIAKRVETSEEIIVTVRHSDGDKEYCIPKTKVDQIQKDEDIIPFTYYHPEIYPYMIMYKFPYYTIKKDETGIEISWRAAELPIHLTGAKYDGTSLKIDQYWGRSKPESS